MSEFFGDSYLYSHGIYEINVGKTIYSSSLMPPTISNGVYESKEYESGGKKTGTTIMVKKIKKGNLMFHYLIRKTNYGWTRHSVVFMEGDYDPYPVDIDEEIYEKYENIKS